MKSDKPHNGRSKHPLYKLWQGMFRRCYEPRDPGYKNYGGRGITVCDEWRDFSVFVSDMGERPSPSHSIDREDNNKGYSKDNCRWATKGEQSRNKRSNVWIEFDGRRMVAADWAKELDLGLTASNIINRINHGWSIKDAITTSPAVKDGSRREEIIAKADWEIQDIRLAEQFGVTREYVRQLRLELGKPKALRHHKRAAADPAEAFDRLCISLPKSVTLFIQQQAAIDGRNLSNYIAWTFKQLRDGKHPLNIAA